MHPGGEKMAIIAEQHTAVRCWRVRLGDLLGEIDGRIMEMLLEDDEAGDGSDISLESYTHIKRLTNEHEHEQRSILQVEGRQL